jgi:hypothetical protein
MAKANVASPAEPEVVQTSVDPMAAEGLLATARLGERIKKLRLKLSIAAGDGPRGADAAQPGADLAGV